VISPPKLSILPRGSAINPKQREQILRRREKREKKRAEQKKLADQLGATVESLKRKVNKTPQYH
jgi:hypothetical protein